MSQAYLFTGIRGTGKTTTARLLAKAVNCTGENPPCGKCENCRAIRDGNFLDVIELDAASNNGVDDLRSIIESVNYPPTIGKYKVYIIDEVHMLSQAAENAFLKTLEEPPQYVIFILATTDPEKVKNTIRSRCMVLNFRRVSEKSLVEGMERICKKKNISCEKEALISIAAKADGSVRDALSILEQCICTGETKISEKLILDYLGGAGRNFYIKLTYAVFKQDIQTAFELLDNILRTGCDARQIITEWLSHYRDLMICRYLDRPSKIINASEENINRLKEQSESINIDHLKNAVKILSECVNYTKYSVKPRIILEAAMLEISEENKKAIPYKAKREPLNEQCIENEKNSFTNELNIKKKAVSKTDIERTTRNHHKSYVGNDIIPMSDDIENDQDKYDEYIQEAFGREESAPQKNTNKKHAKNTEHEKKFENVIKSSKKIIDKKTSLDKIWDNIILETCKTDHTFKIIVGKYSRIVSFKNNEIIIEVKENKVALAETSRRHIENAIERLYGKGIALIIKAGDPGKGKSVNEFQNIESESNENSKNLIKEVTERQSEERLYEMPTESSKKFLDERTFNKTSNNNEVEDIANKISTSLGGIPVKIIDK